MTAQSPPAGMAVLARHCMAVRKRAWTAHAGLDEDHSALLQRAALHLLDWLGCAAQGSTSEQGQVFARWLALQAQGPAPTLAGRRADAGAAAAYHGALGSALEMDDVHRSSILHPGPVVIPAALAAAAAPLWQGQGQAWPPLQNFQPVQRFQPSQPLPPSAPPITGAQWLSALVVGYEAVILVGRCLGPVHYRHWHTTSTAGSFGAAAAAAAVWSLDEVAVAHALALAGTRAGGLWQLRHESSLAKSWHTAGAARDGLAAAQLAGVGLTGPLAVLEGPSGWLAATADAGGASAIDEAHADAPAWMCDVSFKPWPACRHAHPALDALQEALASAPGLPWTAAELEQVEVFCYADALRFCDRPEPVDEAQARFSIQHAVAAWLLWGPAQRAHYQGAALFDERVQALRARVFLHADAAFESAYPQHYGARVLLQRRDGARHSAAVQDTRGDPARPLSVAALQDKACGLMAAAGWQTQRIDAALAACAGLPQAQDLCALQQVLMP